MRTFNLLASLYETPTINALDAHLIASSILLSPYVSFDHALSTLYNSPYPTAWLCTTDGHVFMHNAISDCIAYLRSFPGSIAAYCSTRPHLDNAYAILKRFNHA